MRLGQPNWIAYLTFETTFLKAFQCSGRVSRAQEEIQVLGEAADSGIMPQSKCPRHSVGKTLFLKQSENLAEKSFLFPWKFVWNRGSHWDALGWLICLRSHKFLQFGTNTGARAPAHNQPCASLIIEKTMIAGRKVWRTRDIFDPRAQSCN